MSAYRPVARITCRVVEVQPEQCLDPEGFQVNDHSGCKPRTLTLTSTYQFFLCAGDAFDVGRSHHNDVIIKHPYVSRKAFTIYAVDYEQDGSDVQPLVYVRDCRSLTGTYVNGRCIGSQELGNASAHLLSRGEVICLIPYWQFHIELLGIPELRSPLTSLQRDETQANHWAKLFSDRYFITNRSLGSGSFGSVRLALKVQPGQQVVCKIHNLEQMRTRPGWRDSVRRVMDETDLLGKLHHPNLLDFEFAYKSKDTLYTFTELATGGDLFSMRSSYYHGFEENDARFVVKQIVSAIRYLHKKGIAHRDLKPENIFFAAGPFVTGRVIVGDLGFATYTTSGRMNSRIGTDIFMAPEIYRGQSYGTAVDIWSIGAIILFLLAPDQEKLPCLRELNQEAIDEFLGALFDRGYFNGVLSDSCQSFIRSCMIVDPQSRITAYEAKRHPWLQNDEQGSSRRIREVEEWRPAHLVAPPVVDLDLIKASPGKKRKAANEGEIAMASQQSRHFATAGSSPIKRRKQSPDTAGSSPTKRPEKTPDTAGSAPIKRPKKIPTITLTHPSQ
ncbi:Uu.00g003390.m01.CDS01 [Anthostomella pinea]|uniref:Uu.00g003390.m01.CDS01 n=1 Tax=Anthostomella pinea TaxID=933095 RepID=A0AAI8YGA6_9PEZI|nr:Uu.00g003390.m01.CDS01 [Anthostomella pinea]